MLSTHATTKNDIFLNNLSNYLELSFNFALPYIIFKAFLIACSTVIVGSAVKSFFNAFCDICLVKPSITSADIASSNTSLVTWLLSNNVSVDSFILSLRSTIIRSAFYAFPDSLHDIFTNFNDIWHPIRKSFDDSTDDFRDFDNQLRQVRDKAICQRYNQF